MNNWLVHRYANLARPGCVETVTDFGHCFVGDKNAHTWKVECVVNDEPADLTSYTAHGYFVRTDKSTVIVDAAISGNTVTCVLSEYCYAVEGVLKGVLRIENTATGENVTIGAMSVRLAASATDTIIDSGDTIPSLSDLLAEIDNLRQATSDAEATITAANAATIAANSAASTADTATQRANSATTNAVSAATAANAAATAADRAAENAIKNFGGLSFSVNPVDNGIDITYTD